MSTPLEELELRLQEALGVSVGDEEFGTIVFQPLGEIAEIFRERMSEKS